MANQPAGSTPTYCPHCEDTPPTDDARQVPCAEAVANALPGLAVRTQTLPAGDGLTAEKEQATMTPYIVTVRTPIAPMRIVPGHEVSRRAVATLNEARLAAEQAVETHRSPEHSSESYGPLWRDAALMPESGGTVGPLPDGAVIEVRSVGWEEFGDYLLPRGMVRRLGMEEAGRRVIAAYNEAQE